MTRFVRSAALLAGLLLLSAPASAEVPEIPEGLRFEEPRAKLLILGTFHFKDSGADDYKPKHDVDILSAERQEQVAALLDRLAEFAPTRIAIERRNQERLDLGYRKYLDEDVELPANEIYQLGFRLARRLGHERLYAVDADSRRYEPWVDTKKWAKSHDQGWVYSHAWHKRYKKLYQWEDAEKTKVPLIDWLRYLNTPERISLSHGHYLVGGFRAGGDGEYPGADHVAGWWYARNLRILSNVLRLAREPEDRVLLIIGSGHVPILRHGALASPDVELVEVEQVLAPR